MEYHTAKGLRALYHTLSYGTIDNAPFDTEGEDFTSFLSTAAYLTTEDLRDTSSSLDGGVTRRDRARVRYLAALMPDKTLHEAAEAIHYVLDNRHLSTREVLDIVRGSGRDVPFEKIQQIGKLLASGESLRSTARTVGVAFGTVEAIENFLGIAEQRRLRMVDAACDAVRDGLSTRQFAAKQGIPKSSAHVLMVRGREVLREIGELA